MNMRTIKALVMEEINRIIEKSGPGSARPPQVTDQILPSHDTESKIYGGATLDLDVNGKPNNPKKLGTRDVYNDKPAYSAPKTLSEGMAYHLKNRVPLSENVYRPGTKEFFHIIDEARQLWSEGRYVATAEEYELFQSDIGEWAMHEGRMVPLDFPMWDEDINEAKYKGREVKLGKAGATRSGGRAHVFVRDPKTGNIRKVSFGSSMPDAMGSGPKAKARRKSFGDRHGCAKKDDKTKAGYWACRSTKLFGRNVPGWW
jgi:hypothetical protein